jgi:plasmid stabilization system protein ParE
MERRASITFAASALADLEAVLAWYADQQVPMVGQRLVAEIVERVERLGDYPETGRIVPEFGLHSLREIIHPPFRIVYRHDRERVRVVRIWRSERLLKLPK